MKRLLVLPILFAVAACTHMTSDIQPSADASIRRMEREFAAAANAGNVDGMMALYASNAVLMPPNAPELHGKAEIEKFWSGLVAAKPHVELTPGQIYESCDQAAEIGTYDLVIGSKDDKGKY